MMAVYTASSYRITGVTSEGTRPVGATREYYACENLLDGKGVLLNQEGELEFINK